MSTAPFWPPFLAGLFLGAAGAVVIITLVIGFALRNMEPPREKDDNNTKQ